MVTPVRPLDPRGTPRQPVRTSIRLVDGRVLTGRSRGTVGETLRFEPADGIGGLELVPFDRIKAVSLLALAEDVVAAGLLDGELALVEHAAGRGHLAAALGLLQHLERRWPDVGSAVRACRRRIIRNWPAAVTTD